MATDEQVLQDISNRPQSLVSAPEDFIANVVRSGATGFAKPVQQLATLTGDQTSAQDLGAFRRELATNAPGDLLPTNPDLQDTFLSGLGRGLGTSIPDALIASVPGVGLPTVLAKGALATQQDVDEAKEARLEAIARGEAPEEEPNALLEHAKGAVSLGAMALGGRLIAPFTNPLMAAAPAALRPAIGIASQTAGNLGADVAARTGFNYLQNKPLAPFHTPGEFGEALAGAGAFGVHPGIEQAHGIPTFIERQNQIKLAKAKDALDTALQTEEVAPNAKVPDQIEIKPATEESTGLAVEPAKEAVPVTPTTATPPEGQLLPNAAAEVARSSTKEPTVVETPKLEAKPEEAEAQPGAQAEVDPEARMAEIDKEMREIEDSVMGDTSELDAQTKKRYEALAKEHQQIFSGVDEVPPVEPFDSRPDLSKAPPPFTSDEPAPEIKYPETEKQAAVKPEEVTTKITEGRSEPELSEDLSKLSDDELARAELAAKDNPDALKLIDAENERRAERASLDEGTAGEERLPGDEVDVAKESQPVETPTGDEGATGKSGENPVPGLTPEESKELDGLWAKRKLTDKDEARIDELQGKIPSPPTMLNTDGDAKSAAMFVVRGNGDGLTALRKIASTSSRFADVAKEWEDRFGPILAGLRFKYDPKTNRAHYDPSDHTVYIGEGSLSDRIVLHELSHAITASAVDRALEGALGGKYGDLKGKDYLDGLRRAQSDESVAKPIKDLISSYFTALAKLDPSDLTTRDRGALAGDAINFSGAGGVHYGLTTLHEFLAEAITSSRFQKALNNIKSPLGGTVWTRLVDALRRVMGFDVNKQSLLADVLKAHDEIGDINQKDAIEHSEVKPQEPARKEEDKPYIDRGQPPVEPLEPGMETKDNGLVPSKEIEPTKEGSIGEAPNKAAVRFAPPKGAKEPAEEAPKSFVERATDKLKSAIPAVGRLAERLKPAVRDLRNDIEAKFRGLEFNKTAAATGVRNGIRIAFHGNKEDMAAAYPLLEAGAARIGDPDGPTAQDVRLEVQRELDNGKKALASDQIPDSAKEVIKKFLPAYERALAKFDELVPGTKRVKDAFDASYALRAKFDPDARYTQDYVSRVYELNKLRGDSPLPPESLIGGGKSGITSFDKSRKYDTIMDAMIGRRTPEGGYESETPKSFDVSDLAANHERITQDIVGNKILKDDFETTSYPETHEPLFVPKPTEDHPLPPNYVRLQGPFGTDAYVYKPVADLFKSIWGESSLRQSDIGQTALKVTAGVKHGTLLLDTFHLSRVAQKSFAEAVASGDWQKVRDFKKDMPSYKEQGQMGKYLATLDLAVKDIPAALKEGIITPEDAAYMKGKGAELKARASEGGLLAGRFTDNLWKEAEPFLRKAADKVGAGKAVDALKDFNQFTFGRVTKAAMFSAFESRLARIDRDFPELTQRQRSSKAAKEVNEQFGNLGRGGLLKSKTAQDYAQLFMLAPNWVQSQVMAEARQYGQGARAIFDATVGKKLPNGERERVLRFGNSARFLGTTALAVFAANQGINIATRGHPTWQNPEKDHKLDAWIPGGKTGFFYSPIALASEYAHHLHNYGQYESLPSAVAHIAGNKLSPLASAAKVALTQKDYQGNKLTPGQTVVAAAKQAIPIPILASSTAKGFSDSSKAGTAQQNIAKSLGVSLDRAPDAVAQAYQAFQPYRGKDRPDTGPSPYRDLKTLIQNGDAPDKVKAEVDRLVKDGRKLQDIKKSFDFKPFSGSIAGDLKGLKEGGEDVKKVYDAAKKQKADERAQFYKILQNANSK